MSDLDVVGLIAELDAGDFDPRQLHQLSEEARGQVRATLHERLHRRPDDYAATRGLQKLNATTIDRVDEAFLARLAEPAPRRPAPARRWWAVLGLVAVAALLAWLATRVGPVLVFYLLFLLASLAIGIVCWTTLVWMVYAWRSPAAFDETRVPAEVLTTYQGFSLIVPARHEEQVLEGTLARIVHSEHPAFEVIVVVGDDDPETRTVAERVAAAHPDVVRVVIDDSVPKSKPKALNRALPYCRGDVVGVFDAEDDVNPALIARVDQCFQQSGADVVQAGVQLVNIRSSWFAARNALEYYFWFRSRLHFHARAGFIPLGGNTVFVRKKVLLAAGGWDGECLAEDCELGVRLSSFGAKTVVFYEPELATREETPPTLHAFVKQRTRWSQGYLQTLSRGYWRRLPTRQRILALYTLAMPYLMAWVWVMFPLALLTALLVQAPVLLSIVSFLPAIPMLAVLAVEVVGLGEFCRSFGLQARTRDYVRLILGLPLYQFVLAYASARAVVREARGESSWEKTAHFGLHLDRDSHTPEAPTLKSELVGARTGGNGVASNGNAQHHARVEAAERSEVFARASLRAPELPSRPTRNGGSGGEPAALAVPLACRAGDDEPEIERGLRRPWLVRVVGLVSLFVFVSWVQLTNLTHWPATFFDEGTYISNAWAVPRGALSNYTYGYGHPPLGWLLVSLWTSVRSLFVPTLYSVSVGRELMVLLSIASCLLLYVLARRLDFNRLSASFAVLLFALSPVALYFHRLVLIDNPGVTFALASLVLALSPRRRLWVFAASGACFSLSLLSKETMLVLLPALVLAAVRNSDARTRRYALTLLGSFVILTAVVYPLYATLKGELLPGPGHVSMLGEIQTQLVSRKATGSIFDTTSQTYGTVSYWFHLDPYMLWSACILAPIALFSRTTRIAAVAFLVQAVMVLRPGYLPFMYVIAMLPFAALVVAGTAQRLIEVVRSGPAPVSVPPWTRLRSVMANSWVATARWVTAVLLVAGLVGVFAVGAAPGWSGADRAAMTLHLDGPEIAAKQWIVDHLDHRQRILVADAFWVYLIEHGYNDSPVKGGFFSRTIVFYWPFDFDPAVKHEFPNGWKDMDYVVSTEGMRNDASEVHSTAAALAHSRVVTSFGRGARRIEIRKVEHPDAAMAKSRPTLSRSAEPG